MVGLKGAGVTLGGERWRGTSPVHLALPKELGAGTLRPPRHEGLWGNAGPHQCWMSPYCLCAASIASCSVSLLV